MKLAFEITGRLKKKLPLIFLGCLLAMPFAVVAQPAATYISPAIVPVPPTTYAPQVNATNFINTGTWNITTPASSTLPYRTFSTYNYTNSGTMNCSVGWQFDHGPYPSGARNWSANFFNDNGGAISALDASFISGNTNNINIFSISYLLISATNVLNKGTLTAGSSGEIVIQGSGVNLSRSGLQITPISGAGSVNGTTNFLADTAIYDQYWSGGTNSHTFSNPQVWDGTTVGSSFFSNVGLPCQRFGSILFSSLAPQVAASYTNNLGAFQLTTTNSDLTTTTNFTVYSNQVRQAIFMYVSDTNLIAGAAYFGSALSPTNIFRPMLAQLATTSTNVVTGALQTGYIYVLDNLAAVGTNGNLLANLVISPSALCTDPTYRPDSVLVARAISGNYGSGNNAVQNKVAKNFFYEPLTFSNSFSLGRADAYSALVDNLAAEPAPGFSISNAPGKIIINAKDLNLSKVRMTAGSEILIQASNLVGSAGATIDCQNLSYNLGSTNGLLNLTNLASLSIQRFNGTVSEWSGIWTNYQVNVYTNNYVTNTATGTPPAIPSPLTNIVEIDLAITVIDASSLVATIPVTVQNLILHSTNIVVSDSLNVVNTVLFDGQSLALQGDITLQGLLQNWNASLAPTLRFFTNSGSLVIPNTAHFGDDGATNYAAFVNSGTISAGSQTINADVFQSGGAQIGNQGFYVVTKSGKVENGNISSGQDVRFNAATLKINGSAINANGQLYLNVTSLLTDAGYASGNSLACGNGFDLPVKPPTGDLLGTQLATYTPEFAAVDHYWPGLNLGKTSNGYTNNEAVGQLVLNEGSGSEFLFHASGAQNAIYVDLLDLSQCPDFLDPDVFTIDPNFVIYFAAAKLPPTFTVPATANGVPQEAEEYLNGQLGGHLQWVSSFAGPNSSVDVLVNGQTTQVNKALRYSKIIDSNGNGIPNYYDLNPFNLPVVALSGSVSQNNSQPSAKQFAISWTATANTVYQVQYSTNISPASWFSLLSYTNAVSTNVVVTVWDTNAMSGQRFYRVSHP